MKTCIYGIGVRYLNDHEDQRGKYTNWVFLAQSRFGAIEIYQLTTWQNNHKKYRFIFLIWLLLKIIFTF